MFRRSLLVAIFAAGFAATASAATLKYQATLTGSAEVPPTNSKGEGTARATLNTETHQLTYDVSWHGLASSATMAHFHGPAPVGKNAGIQVWLSQKGKQPTSPLHGTVTLSPEQQQQLTSGMWYVNIHTTNHPGGAIRGQMTGME